MLHEQSALVVHFAFFALFGFILSFVSKEQPSLLALYLFLFAGSTEMIQFFIEGRGPNITDALIDYAGGGTGILAGILCFKIIMGGIYRKGLKKSLS